MEKAFLISENEDEYVMSFDGTINSRKLMKISLFLGGMQGIQIKKESNIFRISAAGLDEYAAGKILCDLTAYLKKNNIAVNFDELICKLIDNRKVFDDKANETLALLSGIKDGEVENDEDFKSFCLECDKNLCITLRDYQYKSAYLLSMGKGGFDFSVPGAGKTIITYAAYAYLKSRGLVDKILVIGPGNAYNAWLEEFVTCFGKEPQFTNLSFETTKECRTYLNASSKNHTEISFINFDKVRLAFEDASQFLISNNALLIVDEAHKVKNPNASVTKAVCEITKYAKCRVVLTGTPMPNGYEDLSSLSYILSPFKDILPYKYAQLKNYTKKGATQEETERIRSAIKPYYSRISKKYLIEQGELKEPIFHFVKCEMDENQITLYELLNQFCGKLEDNIDEDFLAFLKKAALIRKMQISANPALLKKSLVSSMDELKEEYATYSDFEGSEINQLTKADKYITEQIATSEILKIISAFERGQYETKKNQEAVRIAGELLSKGEQVLIWDIFVANMETLKYMLEATLREAVEIINGSISAQDRQDAIARFRSGKSKILLANPSTLAESISLHKVCQNAIYVNRNFNAAQFIQSKDRIHRINMPAGKTATYYFISNCESVDEAVSERLELKESRMLAILDADDIEIGGSEMEDANIMSTEDIDAAFRR